MRSDRRGKQSEKEKKRKLFGKREGEGGCETREQANRQTHTQTGRQVEKDTDVPLVRHFSLSSGRATKYGCGYSQSKDADWKDIALVRHAGSCISEDQNKYGMIEEEEEEERNK